MTLSPSDVKALREALNTLADLGVPSVKQLRADALAILDAQEAAQGVGGFACPICGKEEPHSHSKEEQNSRRLRDAVKFWRQHNMEEDLKSVSEGTREVIKTLVCFADICLRSHRTQPEAITCTLCNKPFTIGCCAKCYCQPESAGDARELVIRLQDCRAATAPNDLEEQAALITTFAARIRTEAVEECAKVARSRGGLEFETVYGIADAIRSLGKRGA